MGTSFYGVMVDFVVPETLEEVDEMVRGCTEELSKETHIIGKLRAELEDMQLKVDTQQAFINYIASKKEYYISQFYKKQELENRKLN